MALLASCTANHVTSGDQVLISLIATNDVHGELVPKPQRGGLVAFSAYVDALRKARKSDGGAVLVIDAGDMWQGTLESNLVEGAAIVEAYNAIGYNAAAIGNHEFDFGPIGSKAVPESENDDPRGALKKRASEAEFPLLAANLIDESTGRPVEWENVQSSVIVNVQGIKIGIIGAISENALQTTISANTHGLRVAPLLETIAAEAKKLRADGASLIIVTAHAGGRCTNFDSRTDSSSCDMGSEIMRLANGLPTDLVDHIFAGHVHQGIAHIVNGISITSAYSYTRAFSRVDFGFCKKHGTVCSRIVHAPHHGCLSVLRSNGACATADDDPNDVTHTVYEGHAILPNARVLEIAEHATTFAQATKEKKLGVYLEAPFTLSPGTEPALANLMTDALLQSLDADVSMHNVVGGIRNILPEGDLTFGSVYEMFPFDNRVVSLELSGNQLREIIAKQAGNSRRRVGFSGMRVFVRCKKDGMDVRMSLADGTDIQDNDRVRVLVNDYLALGGDDILTPAMPDGGFAIDDSLPLTRDVLLQWFRNGPERLNPADYLSTDRPKWNVPDSLPESCTS